MEDSIGAIIFSSTLLVSGLIGFLWLTRRGPWKSRKDEHNWMNIDICERCNEHGPYPQWDSRQLIPEEQARNIHQAFHSLVTVLIELLRSQVRRFR